MAGERATGEAIMAEDPRESHTVPACSHHLHAPSSHSMSIRPHGSQPPLLPAPHRKERVLTQSQHVIWQQRKGGWREGSLRVIFQSANDWLERWVGCKVSGIGTVGRRYFLVHLALATLGTVAGFAHAAHVPHAALGSPSKLRPLPRDGGVCKNAVLFRGSGGKPSLRMKKKEDSPSLDSRGSNNDRSASWEEEDLEVGGVDTAADPLPRKGTEESNSTSAGGAKLSGKDKRGWEVQISSASQVSSEESDLPRFTMECGYSSIPHPLKVTSQTCYILLLIPLTCCSPQAHKGGEDAHIICKAGGSTLVGVFDGVGGACLDLLLPLFSDCLVISLG